MSLTLRNKAMPVTVPAQDDFSVVRKYVFGVNLVAWVHVCAANEALARKVVTSALGSPSRADIRLANEASFILGKCATITDVTFSVGERPARFASMDTIPQGVEIESTESIEPIEPVEPVEPVEPIHARRKRKRRRTDGNLAVVNPDNPTTDF